MAVENVITSDMVAKEAMIHVENNSVMPNIVHTKYKEEFVKVGETVRIKKPIRFEVSDGATRVDQSVEDETIDFVINKRKHVSWGFSTQDLTMSITEYSESFIKPAVIALTNKVDEDLCALYKDVANTVGTAGATPSTYKGFAAGATEMHRFSVPYEARSLVLDPDAHLNAADVLRAVNQPQMVKKAIERQYVGDISNMRSYMDQNVQTHTAGTNSGDTAYQVNGAGQTGSDITIDTGSGTYVVGDVITFALVYSVNPISKVSTGQLRKFTVTEAMADGGTTVKVSPSIITSGAYKNVTGSPADDASIVITATHQANLAFHKNAFGLVMVPLDMPDSVSFKSRIMHNNISLRVLKTFDSKEDREVIRIDMLYGVKTLDPELAVRQLG